MSFWINGKSEEGVSKGWIWFPRKSKPSLKERLAILLFQCGYRHNVITVRAIFWCLLSARHFIDISNSPKPCKASIFILVLQLTKVGLTEVSDPPQAISLVTEWVRTGQIKNSAITTPFLTSFFHGEEGGYTSTSYGHSFMNFPLAR